MTRARTAEKGNLRDRGNSFNGTRDEEGEKGRWMGPNAVIIILLGTYSLVKHENRSV